MFVANYQRGSVSRKIFVGVSPEYDLTYGLTQELFDRGLVEQYEVTNIQREGSAEVSFDITTEIDLQTDFFLNNSGRAVKLVNGANELPGIFQVKFCDDLTVIGTGDPFNHIIITNVLGVTDPITLTFTAIKFACVRTKEISRSDIVPSNLYGVDEFYWPAQDYFTSDEGYPLNGWQWILLPIANPVYPQIIKWRQTLGADFYEVYDMDDLPYFTAINTGDEVIVKKSSFDVIIDGVERQMQLIMWRCRVGFKGSTVPEALPLALDVILNKNM